MTDKILKTIIIVIAIVAGAYVLPRVGCQIDFKDDPVVQVPDYNDYDRKPRFRVAFDSNQYYVEYRTWDMENWGRNDTPLPTREDAEVVVDECEQECRRRYDKIISEAQKNKR